MGQVDLLLTHLEPESASALAFPTLEGEEDVAVKIIDQWQDLPGSFPHVPDQEWAPVQSSDRANRMCQGMVVSPHVELMSGTPYSPASQPSDVHIFGGSGGGLCL